MQTKDFAKIIRIADGRQVLFYVEPEAGDYTLHTIANFEFGQCDIKLEFNSMCDDENEAKAFEALSGFDEASAEKFVAMIEKQFGGFSNEIWRLQY